eukprot:274313_1
MSSFCLLVFLAFLLLCVTVNTDVNVTCYDDSNGCIQAAESLQKCLQAVKPGDICKIPNGGRFGMEITMSNINGEENKPITITGTQSDKTILDGTVEISSILSESNTIWEKANINNNECIYKISLKREIWQLFVNDEMMTVSRWPNALWKDKTVFNSYFAQSLSTKESTLGLMVDAGTVYGEKLSSIPYDLTGTIGVLNIGSWVTYSSIITKHIPKSNNFSFWVSKNWKNDGKPADWRYYLENNINFIDLETEWFIDTSTKNKYELYLYSPFECTSPNNKTLFKSIRGKIQTFSLNIFDSSYVNVEDVTLFATGFNITNSNNIKLQNMVFNYTTTSKRSLGVYEYAPISSVFNNGRQIDAYKTGLSVINSIFHGSDGNIFYYKGNNGIFKNNLFEYISYSCVGYDNNGGGSSNGVGSVWSSGNNDTFIYNTIRHFGPSVGYAPGLHSNASMNLFYNQSELQNDGAFIQMHVKQQNYSIVYKNWGYNSPKLAFRFDSANNPNAATGENGTISHVIAFNTSGIIVKGNKHNITNNVVFNSSVYNNKNYHADICIVGNSTSYAFNGENNMTHTSNCGAVYISGSNSKQSPIPGYTNNDLQGPVQPQLINPQQFDFRPKPTSDYAKHNIGPYLVNDTEYWIPGRQETQTSFPIVSIYDLNDIMHVHLMWRKAYLVKKQMLYLFDVNKALIKMDQFDERMNVWKFTDLPKNGKYFWRVDSIDMKGDVIVGHLWTFAT